MLRMHTTRPQMLIPKLKGILQRERQITNSEGARRAALFAVSDIVLDFWREKKRFHFTIHSHVVVQWHSYPFWLLHQQVCHDEQHRHDLDPKWRIKSAVWLLVLNW